MTYFSFPPISLFAFPPFSIHYLFTFISYSYYYPQSLNLFSFSGLSTQSYLLFLFLSYVFFLFPIIFRAFSLSPLFLSRFLSFSFLQSLCCLLIHEKHVDACLSYLSVTSSIFFCLSSACILCIFSPFYFFQVFFFSLPIPIFSVPISSTSPVLIRFSLSSLASPAYLHLSHVRLGIRRKQTPFLQILSLFYGFYHCPNILIRSFQYSVFLQIPLCFFFLKIFSIFIKTRPSLLSVLFLFLLPLIFHSSFYYRVVLNSSFFYRLFVNSSFFYRLLFNSTFIYYLVFNSPSFTAWSLFPLSFPS
ncbi:unnamed protein product [Acanthosepion pharaonis]|uniref:Uncharacterized protein n=1 Tax=Acanthosepion pharaonis TaxID=158019 RepID=A0A812ESB6_ACAPH|nr:unnamed protein product [Sepia pharaonis]